MCLDHIIPPKLFDKKLKKYQNLKLIKGYKIFTLRSNDKNKIEFHSPCCSFKWKPGWNYLEKPIIEDNGYILGFHLFLKEKTAINFWHFVKDDPDFIVIPAYFYKSDVIAIGTDKKEIVYVTEKLSINKKDYDEAIGV